MPIPHIPQDLQKDVRVIVETKYGRLRGGRTTNGAAIFLEVPYALSPIRFTDPQPLPSDYFYDDKDYIYETKHCYQPSNDGQGEGVASVDRLGFGAPSEDPLFVNIASPSSFTSVSKFPVTVYIHGGFLQYGSPHELCSQAQYAAEELGKVFVNIGYRLSVLGFLACDEPKVDGNFGFKDQWLALEWIQENIAAFGGDPGNVRLTGHSAGGHSVHQILHHISHLPDNQLSPVQTAILHSNAILATPKAPAELRKQFQALCRALNLDPEASDILEILRDPAKISVESLLHVIENDAVGAEYSVYRGCLDGTWMPSALDPMSWQRSGNLARKLHEKGVQAIAMGDLVEEWYLYSIAFPVHSHEDVFRNLLRCYPSRIVEALFKMYATLPSSASAEEAQKLLGKILSDGQVHIPVRLFMRDLQNSGFPVFRYEIHWTPEQLRPKGFVTHETDRCFWALRVPSMNFSQKEVAMVWLHTVDNEFETLILEGKAVRPLNQALTLHRDMTVAWAKDKNWSRLMTLAKVLPGESS